MEEEIIELTRKCKERYPRIMLHIEFWGGEVGRIFDYENEEPIFDFNTIQELRNHLNS